MFILGAAAGTLVTQKVYQQRMGNFFRNEPRMMREFIVMRLSRELHLDPAQIEQLRAIVRETHAQIRDVRRQFRPQIEEILEHSQDRIRAILRPDQRETYERIVAERKNRRMGRENNQ